MTLGFLGESQSGKDWLSQKLITLLPLEGKVHTIRAADKLKSEAELRNPEYFSVEKWEKNKDGYRETVIPIGLKGKNQDHMSRKELKTSFPKNHILIPDLRNESEVGSLLPEGAIIIKVMRDLKYRYPEEYKLYIETLSNPSIACEYGFYDHIQFNFPTIYRKLNHHTETGSNKVPESKIHFKFENNPDGSSDIRLSSLVSKLRPLVKN